MVRLHRLGLLIPLLGSLLSLQLPAAAQPRLHVEDSGKRGEKVDPAGNVVSYQREFNFHGCGPVSYQLRCLVDRNGFGRIAVLGGGWYHNGSLGPSVDGKPLLKGTEPAPSLIQGEGRALVEWRWPRAADVPLRLRALLRAGDDKIFWELKAPTDVPPKLQLAADLVAFPGHFGQGADPPCDRWISTRLRSLRHGKDLDRLDTEREWWALLFDANGNRQGTCALMFLPEECESVTVDQRSNYGVCPALRAEPGAGRLRFIVWSFPQGYKPADSAWRYLKENGGAWLEELREVDFETTVNQPPNRPTGKEGEP